MTTIAWALIASAFLLLGYAYVGYPLALLALGRGRARRSGDSTEAEAPEREAEWPLVSITLPAYNEAAQIRGAIEALLRVDYPADRRQIVVVSDGSTDGTDAIVSEYAGAGVELIRMARRGGKGAAETAAAPHLRGQIVVNTDASIRIGPDALKPLIAALRDPGVGLASGRDVSVGSGAADANRGESGYVGYEMWVRGLETRAGGIVGASGCFYAIRARLHRAPLPQHLSRDFASALISRENGLRAVSVDGATCFVPRTGSLRREYRRKVRTMGRGMETLWHKRALLNPFRYGRFSWMLFSHKVCRWLVPWAGVAGLVGLGLLAARETAARWPAGLVGGVLLVGGVGWLLAGRSSVPRVLSIPAYALAGNVAAIHALLHALRGERQAVWEPTRRDIIATK